MKLSIFISIGLNVWKTEQSQKVAHKTILGHWLQLSRMRILHRLVCWFWNNLRKCSCSTFKSISYACHVFSAWCCTAWSHCLWDWGGSYYKGHQHSRFRPWYSYLAGSSSTRMKFDFPSIPWEAWKRFNLVYTLLFLPIFICRYMFGLGCPYLVELTAITM